MWAFGAITDTGNISSCIHRDVNTSAPHLWNKSQKLESWAAYFWDIRMWPWLPHEKLLFITYHPSFKYGIYYTNTGSYITGIYWPHKTTLYGKSCHICHQWHSTFNPSRCYLVDYNQHCQSSTASIIYIGFAMLVEFKISVKNFFFNATRTYLANFIILIIYISNCCKIHVARHL